MNDIVKTMLREARDHATAKRSAALIAYGHSVKAADLEQRIDARENEIMAEVCAETNGDGVKKLYSNDTERKAQVVVRSMSDPAMQTLQAEMLEARKAARTAESERDYAHDCHRSITAALNAMRTD